ncbi:DUF5666 domain-containing protein [Sulfobacillus harzensis]|uniref:DUF5666 domain-containing protein n=1 Tax=Sulfobacillus harzensis TaxID=2729629 RepID=A0A7Y0L605_9FIRM|nr:DUF5666 domain-containing protein [Sulfobacillus harzensis]NMP23381.1 hypothetical protein [Sulfobacillus harzensis]
MNKRFNMSRRTAGWLVAIFAALVVIHYAYNTSAKNLAQTVMGKPAAAIALRGEVTQLDANKMTVTVEDTHGDLTNLSRTITLTNSTRFLAPGKPQATGQSGFGYLKTGYRVSLSGQVTAQNGIDAQVVQVNFPPINGTVEKLAGSQMTLNVSGQPAPAVVNLTSHTAYFMPNGDVSALKQGAGVRVWVIPNGEPDSGLTAVTVMVNRSQ